ncbi:MAG: Zn-ribbon domain-containing OB-fold protein [Desulfobacterales bacterium]|nr:Zn-ribbon domain-containing OB-fold protein [Desulfobacterales bacterium]
MTNWFEDVAELTHKGQIKVPYTWSVGEVGSRFLVALRDQKRILGNRCGQCRTVFVPPRNRCGKCFGEIHEWIELGDEGIVTAHTIVRYNHPIQPTPTPFAYAIVKLDGADVGFIHIIKEDLGRLKNGVRVKARFSESRRGHILDIDSFTII